MKPIELMRYRAAPNVAPWVNVVSLLFPGADGSTTFVDDTGRTWTTAGNAQVDNSLGYNSGLFDGTGDYATTPYVSDFNWWTGDFRIDAYVRPTDLSKWSYADGAQVSSMIGNGNPSGFDNYWSFGPRNDGKLVFNYYNGSAIRIVSAASIAINVLNKISLLKTASGIQLAVNDGFESPVAVSGTPQSSGTYPLVLGQIASRSIQGNIKSLIIQKR